MNTRRSASHTGGTATCTERAVCEVCKEPYGELAAHTGGTATCTERAVCEVCNQPYGEPPAHTGGTGTFTCTTGKICEKCGVEYGILGHAWYWWGEWISAGNGTHTRRCTRCSTVETEDCIGGTATCTAKAVCMKCGKEYGDLAPHQLKTFKRPATCQQEGLEYTRCTEEGCNYRTPDIITPKQHILKKAREFTREPTCTKPGWKSWYLCTTCTTYSETDWVEALGHDPILHEAKAPTCTEKGWSAYETCSRCNYTTYAEQAALNHNLEQHAAKAPTCTEIGWDAYDTCSDCDYTTYVEIPASGHALTRREAKAATCTEIGWDAYDTCGNCGYTTYTEIPASGHVLTNYGENWGLVFCPVCGKAENGERLELLETASAAAVDGKLPEGELVARMNQRYLSLAFVHEGKLTAPAGRVKITLPAEIMQGKRLLLIAPDGTETELPFETVGETISFTLDFTEVEIPAVLVLKPL